MKFQTVVFPFYCQVYVSYDYGTTFVAISEQFQLTAKEGKEPSKQVISQFYHSPADNKRVCVSLPLWKLPKILRQHCAVLFHFS